MADIRGGDRRDPDGSRLDELSWQELLDYLRKYLEDHGILPKQEPKENPRTRSDQSGE